MFRWFRHKSMVSQLASQDSNLRAISAQSLGQWSFSEVEVLCQSFQQERGCFAMRGIIEHVSMLPTTHLPPLLLASLRLDEWITQHQPLWPSKHNQWMTLHDTFRIQAEPRSKEIFLSVVPHVRSRSLGWALEILRRYYQTSLESDELLRLLKQETVETCPKILVEMLGQQNCQPAGPRLVPFLKTQEVLLLISAIETLGILNCREAISSLSELLSHQNMHVSGGAFRALGKMQAEELLPVIRELNARTKGIPEAACEALGNLLHLEEARMELSKLLHDQVASQTAAGGLGKATSPLVAPFLEEVYHQLPTKHKARGRIVLAMLNIAENCDDARAKSFLQVQLRQDQDIAKSIKLSLVDLRLLEMNLQLKPDQRTHSDAELARGQELWKELASEKFTPSAPPDLRGDYVLRHVDELQGSLVLWVRDPALAEDSIYIQTLLLKLSDRLPAKLRLVVHGLDPSQRLQMQTTPADESGVEVFVNVVLQDGN